MGGHLQMDESAFPLVVATFTGHVTADVVGAYFARVDAWCKDRRRYAAVLDISRTDVPSAAERRHVAKEMAARHAAITRCCAGTAIVLTSAMLRGAVTAVLWLQPMKHPVAIVATRASGREMCVGWLATAPAA
jgi:hypothetical protein